ncbi:glycine betaine ABC transporter substrate-binding protein [Allobranchiibius sp. GilTou38]|uniref:glycine betaine ABC transporter substrate-binding protein n=1 Tax=Allobranchiibius sp. GilTou38 TaxID=2815210 RepID=UPI001AA1BB38|nr:glycine betaine ABC transporter substrate-binding protein [Allobranchiibius sp. GilTou38]MBO1768396.1 hypothetical protein [Allobranchiibius sp. GilTou38]
MIKRTISIVAVAGLGLGLAACGKDSSKSGSGSGSGSAAAGTVASKLIMGGPAEFQTRADGLPGLKKNYGVAFGKYTVTDTGGPVTIGALKNGQVDAADIFTTDPSIKADNFVVLTDPKHNFAAQNIIPLVSKSKATPGVEAVLNAVSATLSTAALRDLVTQAVTDKKDPDAVAKSFLSAHPVNMSGKASGASLTVGSANFPENVVLAEIYAEALKSAGAKVSTKLNIGSREKYFPALKSGSINVFPEYNGAVLSYLQQGATEASTTAVDTALSKALPSSIVALKPAEAQDSDAIVVTKATADKYKLVSIADLAKKG